MKINMSKLPLALSVDGVLPPDATFVEATSDDIDVIVAQRSAMFREMRKYSDAQIDASNAPFARFVVEAMGVGQWRHLLVRSTLDGAPLAGAALWLMPWMPHPSDLSSRRGNVLNVYTAVEARRRGLARALVRRLVQLARTLALETVVLNASDAGRLVYLSLGFEPTNEMKMVL